MQGKAGVRERTGKMAQNLLATIEEKEQTAMCTSRTDYVIYGHKFDSLKAFNEHIASVVLELPESLDAYDRENRVEQFCRCYDDNAYEDKIGGHHRLVIVTDGMNGGYAVAGYALAKGCIDNDSYSGIDMTDCTPDRKTAKTVKDWLNNVLGMKVKPHTWAFTHWH
jgi:hypothetical protein